jgi:hypothetical protein
MLINPVSNGLLWAAYLLCLLLSGVQSPYPATGVVPNVTPTGGSGDTYVNTRTFSAHSIATSAWPPFGRLYPIVDRDASTNNLKSFTADMTMRYQYSTGYTEARPAVIKDSLVLGASVFWQEHPLPTRPSSS